MSPIGSRGEVRQFWRTFSRNQLALAAGVVVGVLVVLAVLAPLLAPWDPNKPDTKRILAPPSRSHWLGTDQLGRDVLSRVLYGSRVSLAVGFVSVGIATLIGVVRKAESHQQRAKICNALAELTHFVGVLCDLLGWVRSEAN